MPNPPVILNTLPTTHVQGQPGHEDEHDTLSAYFNSNGAGPAATVATNLATEVTNRQNADSAHLSANDPHGDRAASMPFVLTGAALPTAAVAYRGQLWTVTGNGTSTADVTYICLMSATGTYSWKQVVSG